MHVFVLFLYLFECFLIKCEVWIPLIGLIRNN